jgi:hypothetical protein
MGGELVTQYIITTAGRHYGVVLDVSPMTDSQSQAHRHHFGARTIADITLHARFLAGHHPFMITRLAARPKRFASCGRHARRYEPEAFCVPVAA